MTEDSYKTAYLSLAISLSDGLRSVQQEVCERYALIPRTEIHLTIAFFGENTVRQLADLACSLLDLLPATDISQLRINGIGGAYKIADELKLIKDEGPDELIERPAFFGLP